MAEQKPKGKLLYTILYPCFGGFRLSRLLKKNKHKKEQEKQIKQDYSRFCFKGIFSSEGIRVIAICGILLFIIYKFATPGSDRAIFMNFILIPTMICTISFYFSDQRKKIRNDIIYEICDSCGEYDNWERNEKLVDKESALESDIEYHDSTIHGRNGKIYVSTPVSVLRHVTYYTYYVTRKCNCCGQILYHYEQRKR